MDIQKRVQIIMDLGVNQALIPQIQSYIDLLWTSNEELNLLSRKMSFDELLDNHLIDCLLALKYFPKDVNRIADFGTGGGLPGVLYAIIFADKKFDLYEKSRRKQEYLNKCQNLCTNIQIKGDIPIHLLNTDLIITRAFKPIDVTLDMSRHYYENGGKYFLLKGKKEKIDEEMQAALKKFKDLKAEIIELSSPVLEVERHLVLLQKQ
jgi:16S rRNA (guanine527-N7)-methyltransferase